MIWSDLRVVDDLTGRHNAPNQLSSFTHPSFALSASPSTTAVTFIFFPSIDLSPV